MIQSHDRSGYFGASDTKRVVAKNRNTESFKKFWNEKLGGPPTFFANKHTIAGTKYEHSIIRAVAEDMNWDRQIILDTPRMLLRVNYDGNDEHNIYEIKTHASDKVFEITEEYWMQAQVEMYAWKYAHEHGRTDSEFVPVEKLDSFQIVSYALNAEELNTADLIDDDDAYAGRLDIDHSRLKFHPVKYDKSWIKGEYLPALKELTKALRKGKYPY